MKRLAMSLFAILLLLPGPSASATNGGPPPPEGALVLTLSEALAIALEQNRGLSAAALSAAIDALDPEAARGIYDSLLQLNASARANDRSGVDGEGLSTGSSSEGQNFSIAAIRPTKTGGRWTLEYAADRTEASSTGVTDPVSATSFGSEATLRYTQPLLEGSGSDRVRSPITQAELSAAISAEGVVRQARTLEATVTGQYLGVLRAQRQLEVAGLSLAVAERLKDQVDAQYEAGTVAQFEVVNAEGGLATRQEGVLLAEQSLNNNLDALRQTLGLPLDTPLVLADDLNIDPVAVVATDTVYPVALENRSEVLILDLREELAKESLENARDALQDDLNFTASAGLSGEGEDYGEAVGEMDDFAWTLGLEYLIPLGTDHRAETQFTQAELSLQQLALERSETESQIETDVSQSLRALITAGERLTITATGVAVAERRLENEQARLDLGLSTTTLVLDVEQDLADARLRRIQAELDFAQAKADLLGVLGLSQLEPAPLEVGEISLLRSPPAPEVSVTEETE